MPETNSKTKHHGHFQIEYVNTDGSGNKSESLLGFDPRIPASRKNVHDLLDIYLNVVADRLNNLESGASSTTTWEEEGFHVFPDIE